MFNIKQFKKGQTSVYYIKLKNTELTVKLYKNKQNAMQTYEITKNFGKIKKLKVPKLYPLKEGIFQYQKFFGLCFYYIEGSKISAIRLTKKYFSSFIDIIEINHKELIKLHLREDIIV